MILVRRIRYVLVIPTKRRTCTAAMILVLVHLDYGMLVLVLVSYIPGTRYKVRGHQSRPSCAPFVRHSLHCTGVQEIRVLY